MVTPGSREVWWYWERLVLQGTRCQGWAMTGRQQTQMG